MRLNPREQRANPLMGIGVAHFFAGRLEEARAALLRSLQEKSELGPYHIAFLASCYAHMGRLDEAREVVRRLRTMTNVISAKRGKLARPRAPRVVTCQACAWRRARQT